MRGPATSFGMGLKARLFVTCPEPLRLPRAEPRQRAGNACAVRRRAALSGRWPAAQQDAHLLPMLGSWNMSLMPSGGGSIRAPSSTADSANVCLPSAQLYLPRARLKRPRLERLVPRRCQACAHLRSPGWLPPPDTTGASSSSTVPALASL